MTDRWVDMLCSAHGHTLRAIFLRQTSVTEGAVSLLARAPRLMVRIFKTILPLFRLTSRANRLYRSLI